MIKAACISIHPLQSSAEWKHSFPQLQSCNVSDK